MQGSVERPTQRRLRAVTMREDLRKSREPTTSAEANAPLHTIRKASRRAGARAFRVLRISALASGSCTNESNESLHHSPRDGCVDARMRARMRRRCDGRLVLAHRRHLAVFSERARRACAFACRGSCSVTGGKHRGPLREEPLCRAPHRVRTRSRRKQRRRDRDVRRDDSRVE